MSLRLMCLSFFLFSLFGCGRTSTDSDDPTAKPSTPPATPTVPAGSAKTPAPKPTVFGTPELAKVLDLAALPHKEETEFTQKSPAHVTGTALGTIPEVLEDYRTKMAALGWQTVPIPGAKITDEYGSLQFVKDGHIAFLHTGKGFRKANDPPKTSFTLAFHGNFDVRTLPHRDGKFEDHSTPTSAVYSTKNAIADEGAWAAKALQAAGWQEYCAFGMKDKAPDPSAVRTFRKDGYGLQLYVSKYTPDGDTKVLYRTQVLAYDIPAPPNAVKVEFEDNQLKLSCETPDDLKTTGAFYQKAMPRAGYTLLPSEEPKAKFWNLDFATDDGKVLMVQMRTIKGDATKVDVVAIRKDVLEKIRAKNKAQ